MNKLIKYKRYKDVLTILIRDNKELFKDIEAIEDYSEGIKALHRLLEDLEANAMSYDDYSYYSSYREKIRCLL